VDVSRGSIVDTIYIEALSVFRDLEELIMAIGNYIDRHNRNPKPFIWTACASDILEKVKRARRALHKRQSA
jgi:hypothetical protein